MTDEAAPTYNEWAKHRACQRKRVYTSQLAANTAVLEHWRDGKDALAYHCDHCGNWHITQHPRKEPPT